MFIIFSLFFSNSNDSCLELKGFSEDFGVFAMHNSCRTAGMPSRGYIIVHLLGMEEAQSLENSRGWDQYWRGKNNHPILPTLCDFKSCGKTAETVPENSVHACTHTCTPYGDHKTEKYSS